jgi:hypothetical protein
MPNPADDLAGPNHLAGADRHGSRSEVGVEREGFGSLDDHVVPGHQLRSAPGRIEPDRVPQGDRELANHLDPGPLGHPVHGRHDPLGHPVHGRHDLVSKAA